MKTAALALLAFVLSLFVATAVMAQTMMPTQQDQRDGSPRTGEQMTPGAPRTGFGG